MKMKNVFVVIGIVATTVTGTLFMTSAMTPAAEPEFLQITAVESVVPGGLGRSRMIAVGPNGVVDEIKMENFFSMVGINFENIRFNDRVVTDKISKLTKDGWVLQSVNTGVYAADKSTGIFITRYLFRKG